MAKKKAIQFESWDDVDKALRRMGEIDILKTKVEGDMNLKINAAKEEAERLTAAETVERKQLEKAVLEYAESRKEEFTGARKKELTFGYVAFKVVTSVSWKNAEAVIKALKSAGMSACVKVKETPDKDELKKLDANTLTRVGAWLEIKDKPRCEPDIQKIAEAK
ncbi:MAG: Bacteriophage Mu Gam like protein [bacterium ADurb.Bin236]|nr:MAG: Bacteriophage Mu Gam like protein [bacterium ADurb.Bin236]